MEPNVAKEVENLKQMMINWKKSFLVWVEPAGGNTFIIIEFNDEIQTHFYPYVTRLLETENLTEPEARALMDFAYGQIIDLKKQIDLIENA